MPYINLYKEGIMAKIIDSGNNSRRIIRLSADDVISIVREYQNTVQRSSSAENTRDILENRVFCIPEDI